MPDNGKSSIDSQLKTSTMVTLIVTFSNSLIMGPDGC